MSVRTKRPRTETGSKRPSTRTRPCLDEALGETQRALDAAEIAALRLRRAVNILSGCPSRDGGGEEALTRDELANIAARNGGRGTTIRCPAHEDLNASLSVSLAKSGRLLVHCFAGCRTEDVCRALGIELKDLMCDDKAGSPATLTATYTYRDEKQTVRYQVLRYAPKGFRQRRLDEKGGWIWNLKGVRRVLYRLPELLAAAERRVLIVEGEKDADRLASLGFVTTTNSGGAGKWRSEFSECLRGRHVVILPDNDEPGRRHGEDVARSLSGVAASVRVLLLPGLPDKGDASDWLDAGGTAEELKKLARGAPEWRLTITSPRTVITEGGDAEEIVAVTFRLSDVMPESVSFLWNGRIPFGKISTLEGDPGLGKSTVLLDAAARLTTGRPLPGGPACTPASVVILSGEDGLADTIRPRLEAAGADLDRIFALTAVRGRDGIEDFPSIARNLEQLERCIHETGARMVIVDPLMAYLGAEVNSYRDQDMRRVLAPLAAMTERTRVASVLVRHLRKSKEGGAIYAGGGSIGIGGAARSVLLVAKHPEDEQRRVVASAKSNLSKPPESLAYRIKEDQAKRPFIAWEEEPVGLSADQLLATAREGGETRSARSKAEEFLLRALADGPHLSDEVTREAERAGIPERTLARARSTLGVRAEKERFDGPWLLSLPPKAANISPRLPPSELGSLRPDLAALAESQPAASRQPPVICSYFCGSPGSPCERCGGAFTDHVDARAL